MKENRELFFGGPQLPVATGNSIWPGSIAPEAALRKRNRAAASRQGESILLLANGFGIFLIKPRPLVAPGIAQNRYGR